MQRRVITPSRWSQKEWASAWAGLFIVCFIAAQFMSACIVIVSRIFGAEWSLQTTTGALWFRTLNLFVFVGLLLVIPYLFRNRRMPSLSLVGLPRLAEWKDILLGAAGVVVYLLIAMVVLWTAQRIPGFNPDQAQNLGISMTQMSDRLLIFGVLVVLTPFVEELLFRGFLYGRLRQHRVPAWGSALIVSVLFGIAHMQWNVGLDVFCLSLVACYAREISGSIWPGILMHMLKNGLAFYALILTSQGAILFW